MSFVITRKQSIIHVIRTFFLFATQASPSVMGPETEDGHQDFVAGFDGTFDRAGDFAFASVASTVGDIDVDALKSV